MKAEDIQKQGGKLKRPGPKSTDQEPAPKPAKKPKKDKSSLVDEIAKRAADKIKAEAPPGSRIKKIVHTVHRELNKEHKIPLVTEVVSEVFYEGGD